jgi:hypothetical protein
MTKFLYTLLLLLVEFNIIEVQKFKLDIDPVAPIYWVDENSIFVNGEEKAFVFDVSKREIVSEYNKKENEIVGIEDSSIFICKWENRKINSPDEYSTHLEKKDAKGDVILDIELKPTLEVLECRENILLRTVYPIEEKLFVFREQLYQVKKYRENMWAPKFRYLIRRDSLGKYEILQFRLSQLF